MKMRSLLIPVLASLSWVVFVGCMSLEPTATPTPPPELLEIQRIEAQVQTACDTFIRDESNDQGLRFGQTIAIEGYGGEDKLGLSDAVDAAYSDALDLLNTTNAQSPHAASIRDTVARIATLKRHTDEFLILLEERIEQIVENPELDPEYWPQAEQWDTTAVELCVKW